MSIIEQNTTLNQANMHRVNITAIAKSTGSINITNNIVKIRFILISF
jgi:hypothetical protein